MNGRGLFRRGLVLSASALLAVGVLSTGVPSARASEMGPSIQVTIYKDANRVGLSTSSVYSYDFYQTKGGCTAWWETGSWSNCMSSYYIYNPKSSSVRVVFYVNSHYDTSGGWESTPCIPSHYQFQTNVAAGNNDAYSSWLEYSC